jgi:RNA polymerase sigma factor (sigma-70 family)
MTTPIARETKSFDREAEPGIPGRGRGERDDRADPRIGRGQRRTVGAVRGSLGPLLSAAEECVLAERVKAGDAAAQHQLILANRNLVLAIVRDYKNCGLEWDDLVQEGNLGLIRASQDFDPVAYGSRFQTYASFWIRTSIHRALVVNGSLIRRSEYVSLLRLRYVRAIRALEGRSEGVDEEGDADLAQTKLDAIAERMGVSLRKVKTAQRPQAGGKRVAVEELAAVRQPPDADLIDQENDELLHAALFRLHPFEAWVIRERYGFRPLRLELYGWAVSRHDEECKKDEGGRMKDEPENPSSDSTLVRNPSSSPKRPGRAYYHRTYSEIGMNCGLSVHRVRLVEKAALDKLRKFLVPRLAVGGG